MKTLCAYLMMAFVCLPYVTVPWWPKTNAPDLHTSDTDLSPITPYGPNTAGICEYQTCGGFAVYCQWWNDRGRDLYNANIEKYGARFAPPLVKDDQLVKDGIFWKANQTAVNNRIKLSLMRAQDK